MISAYTRRTVRTLYAFSCGYCGVSETEVGSQLTIYHFVPQDANGSDDVDNLVYACHACNMHKAAAWNGQTPPVLHPLRTDMTLHVALLPDDTLQALTPEGERHIATLHLNRSPLIERRKKRRFFQTLMEQEAQRLERDEALLREIWKSVKKASKGKRKR